MHQKHRNISFQANYKVTLLSNLIDVSSSLELEYVSFVPPHDFKRHLDGSGPVDKNLDDSGLFNESRLIGNYNPSLPNRPYTFE